MKSEQRELLGLIFGAGIGLCVGIMIDNIATGLSLGAGVGLVLGIAFGIRIRNETGRNKN